MMISCNKTGKGGPLGRFFIFGAFEQQLSALWKGLGNFALRGEFPTYPVRNLTERADEADSPYQGADSPRRGPTPPIRGRWAKPRGGREHRPLRRNRKPVWRAATWGRPYKEEIPEKAGG